MIAEARTQSAVRVAIGRMHARERWTTLTRLRRSAEELVALRSHRWSRLSRRIEPAIDGPGAEYCIDSGGIWHLDGAEVSRAREERVAVVRRIIARLVSGESAGVGALDEVIEELLDESRRRPESYAALALGVNERESDLAEHCFTTGALSLGIALRLAWSPADVRGAALAGFLADAGLALLPAPLRAITRTLTDEETNAVRRHTAYSAALVERMVGGAAGRALPESAHLAIYQHHERCDGSGYPTGARGERIHDIAKVIAAADVFAGLTAERAHRPALGRGAAMSEVARQANVGALDPASVLALVEVCGMLEIRNERAEESIEPAETGAGPIAEPDGFDFDRLFELDESAEGPYDLAEWQRADRTLADAA